MVSIPENNMQNIYELTGNEIEFDGEKYYVLNIKKKGLAFYCFRININSRSLKEGAQILELRFKDGELDWWKYYGDDYQSLLDEFFKPENLKQCLQFMYILKDVLSKESKKSQE